MKVVSKENINFYGFIPIFAKIVFTVEFGCSKADRPKVSANIMFAYTYMILFHHYSIVKYKIWGNLHGKLLRKRM